MTALPDHGVAIPISAPIRIGNEAFGDWEGFALSHPNGPGLLHVCLAKWDSDTHRMAIGEVLSLDSTPEPDANRHAACVALWAEAMSEETRSRLIEAWSDRQAMRREYARADQYRDEAKEIA